MPVALVVHSDVGHGPAICARLGDDGFEVMTIGAIVDRSTVGDEVARAASGGLDLLVNNAIRFDPVPSLEADPARFSDALDVGLHSAFSACREAVRAAAGRGSGLTIVNVVSVLAAVALPERAAEACVSAGVLAMTKALAAEWGPVGIRVVAVMVGPTEAWARGIAGGDIPGVVPLQRPVDDADVAAAVAVLAGPDSSAVTGQALVVDNGWLAHGWRRERS